MVTVEPPSCCHQHPNHHRIRGSPRLWIRLTNGSWSTSASTTTSPRLVRRISDGRTTAFGRLGIDGKRSRGSAGTGRFYATVNRPNRARQTGTSISTGAASAAPTWRGIIWMGAWPRTRLLVPPRLPRAVTIQIPLSARGLAFRRAIDCAGLMRRPIWWWSHTFRPLVAWGHCLVRLHRDRTRGDAPSGAGTARRRTC